MDAEIREIDAVHENDLKSVLQKAGALDSLEAGTVKCKFCGTQITLENIHSILPQPDGFSFTCDNPICVQKLAAYLETKNAGRVG